MEKRSSPERLNKGSIGMDVSPMSNIVNDLSKSVLDSGSTEKRYLQRSRDAFGASHRTNDQRSEGFIDVLTKTTCRSDMTNADILGFCKNQLSPHGQCGCKREYGCEKENKENYDATNSLYNPTPQKTCRKIVRPLESRKLYSHSHSAGSISDKEEKGYGFHPATGTAAPRRMLYSPLQSPVLPNTRTSLLRDLKKTEPNFLRSLSSGYESMDDGLVNELVDMEAMDDETQLPSDLSKLLSGNIVAPETSMDCDVSTTPEWSRNNPSSKKPSTREWSIQRGTHKHLEINAISSPLSKSSSLSKIRTCLFRSPTATCSRRLMRTFSYDENSPTHFCVETSEISPHSIRSSYKRPSDEMPEDEKSILKKSRRSNSFHTTPRSAFTSPTMRPKLGLQRSLSETETHTNIKWAVHRSVTDTDLIGDFSKPCILPVTMGHHPDLKTITSDTLAALLRGEFADRIGSYKIIDCRYPYEYEGGHIAGSLNLYDKGLMAQFLFDPVTSSDPKIQTDVEKRDILIFHCEFSWERGPNLSRLLRRMDREFNEERYPALFYPEIYLLQGGYEKFYGEQKEFCLPQDYKPMRHPNHEREFRFFRNKSKSWQGDKPKGTNQTVRTHLKRLGF